MSSPLAAGNEMRCVPATTTVPAKLAVALVSPLILTVQVTTAETGSPPDGEWTTVADVSAPV
jgi:hypothetical protein